MNKVFASPDAAVADIADGLTVAIGGFGVGHSYPNSLTVALRDHGARGLRIVANSLGGGGAHRPQILVENGQVDAVVVSFSARPGMPSPEEALVAEGKLALEMVPQGILVDRLRAAGAGLRAFYSPVTVGTPLANGKEVRDFDGNDFVLEHALPVDVAFIRGWRADRYGNVQFRGSSAHFHASFAKAAKLAIVEVQEIVEPGVIPPHEVDLPGIFVHRVVQSTITLGAAASKMKRRAPESGREYFGKPALSRSGIARRAAGLVEDGDYINLGSGLPTLVAGHIQGRGVFLHAENGALAYDLLDDPEEFDSDFFDAAGNFIRMRAGGAVFDSVVSFEVARSGKLSSVMLGAYQVSGSGDLANWATPGQIGGGIGGAMDLAASGAPVVVVMEHTDSKGRPKLVEQCAYPLTAPACVKVIVTDLALFRWIDGRFVVEEIAPGFTPDEIRAVTPMSFDFATDVRVLGDVELC
ncbi:ScoB [Novosphingobium sp. Rr 2-17]|uniref:3-oxoacid CoA-transferase n=1 Tax=Novosphingobium sp. Rr 2-17 TaxID=555793 RepID=UPI0002697BAB|nr:3-oxoacid CoA-transferase subunit A [Novosphingobium sp. Rr 2-17]EIZ78343.1 ScoB [Novosphingobium sp. Rr 2-17]